MPFLARERELAWLGEQWRAAVDGPARFVLVVGEPGIGKSRLVHEFSASVSAEGYRAFTLVCRRPSALTPLQPFGAIMGSVPDDPDMALAWLEACGGLGPTLLVIEDAHWADPSTIEVVGAASRLKAPLLLVLTARPEPVPGSQSRVSPARRLHLERLSPPDARRMVELVLDEELGDELVDDLVARAEGVPLYLEELARHAAAHGSVDPTVIPDTLMAVIASRLDRLGDSVRVAQMASVVGREFDVETVRVLCDLDDGQIEKHLWRLAEHAVLNPSTVPIHTMSFRHSLIRQAAYASLGAPERRRAHSAVADMLLAAGRAAAEPQIAAYHLAAAARFGEAVAMWRNAARAARRHARFNEAAGHERQVLALLPDLEESHRDSVELKARSRLAMCLTAVDQGAPEILSQAVRAQELARVYGDEQTLLDTYLILLPYWQAGADYRSIDAALPEIRELTRRVADPGYRYSLSVVEACVRLWQGSLGEGLRQLGEMFERGGIPLRESLRSLPPLNPPTVLMRSSSRVAAALGLWLTGDARSAWRLVDDTLLFASERGVPAAHAVASATAALIAQLDGDRTRVAGLARQAERAPAETATLQWRSWGAALRRWAEGGTGNADIPGPMLRPYFLMLAADDDAVAPGDALRMLDEALDTARATGEQFCEAELLRIRGRARQRQGDPDGAAADFRQAVSVARSQLARALELKALTDLVAVGDESARGRLRQVLASLRLDGPQLTVREAARVLGAS